MEKIAHQAGGHTPAPTIANHDAGLKVGVFDEPGKLAGESVDCLPGEQCAGGSDIVLSFGFIPARRCRALATMNG